MKTPAQQHYPSQGKSPSAAEMESLGTPGAKEPEPSVLSSMSSDEGDHDVSGLEALCSKRGMPYSGPYPDNVSGEVESDNPTKGEGATNPDY